MNTRKDAERIPVGVLTGFLGSGKTTVLRRILEAEEFGNSAVLINEFGEVGLDHVLVGEIAPDVVLLNSGCLCCTLRGELRDALASLLSRRTRGEVPPFTRLIVETTGIARPSLILSTVFADPQIRHHYTVSEVVTTVDAIHATAQSKVEDVWMEQVASADVLLITKVDLVGVDAREDILKLLDRVNPTARKMYQGSPEFPTLFAMPKRGEDAHANERLRFDWLSKVQLHSEGMPHNSNVSSKRIVETRPLDWEAFGVWLSMLLHAHGDGILRVKGLLYIEESEGPVVIQGVQHVIYPPEHLPSWNGLERMTDLVFIMRGLDADQIEKSFDVFMFGSSREP